jgi:hypothetical protein
MVKDKTMGVGLLKVDLRGGGGGGNEKMRSLVVSGMVMRDEVSAKEAFLGSVTTQTVVRMYANAAIDNYIKAAKPEGAEDSGRPVVIHSSLETGPNGRKVNILQFVFANLKVGELMNLLGTGQPALDIWPPGVRAAQTCETELKVFKTLFDNRTGEPINGVREIVSFSAEQGGMREGWKSASRAVQDAITTILNGDEGDRFMVAGGRDLRVGMTKTEREAFIRGMARLTQNNSMKLIEGMSEQVGEELRGELVNHKEVAKRQQEQLESQQGRIKHLEDMITAMNDGAPPLLTTMMMAEKTGERKRERDEA